jgi:hypothetical protein
MSRRPAVALVCALVSACIVAACGGSSGNGVASKSPEAIIRAASDAIKHARSVHVSGSIVATGTPLHLDLALLAGKGGRGQVSEGALSFRLVALGPTVYLYGSPAFWQRYAGATAAKAINGRWVKATAAGPLSSLASLTNMQRLIDGILLSHGSLSKGPTTTINGRQAVKVSDPTGGGTFYYVATTGPPYPIEIRRRGADSVQITLDRFDQPVSLTPPANAVSASGVH